MGSIMSLKSLSLSLESSSSSSSSPEVPDLATLLKVRDQLVLVKVLWNFSTEDLQQKQLCESFPFVQSSRSIIMIRLYYPANTWTSYWTRSPGHTWRITINSNKVMNLDSFSHSALWTLFKYCTVQVYRCTLTSQPLPGEGPSQPGGGPPYFLCPVVTSRLYPVLSRMAWKCSCLSYLDLKVKG